MENYYDLSLRFVNELEGFKTNFKNLHWSAVDLTYHRVIDDLLSELIEFQDTVAECSQGYLSRQYPMGSIAGVSCNSVDPINSLNALNQCVAAFLGAISSEVSLSGVVNAVNDFQQTLLKYKYLFSLASKDGAFQNQMKTPFANTFNSLKLGI